MITDKKSRLFLEVALLKKRPAWVLFRVAVAGSARSRLRLSGRFPKRDHFTDSATSLDTESCAVIGFINRPPKKSEGVPNRFYPCRKMRQPLKFVQFLDSFFSEVELESFSGGLLACHFVPRPFTNGFGLLILNKPIKNSSVFDFVKGLREPPLWHCERFSSGLGFRTRLSVA